MDNLSFLFNIETPETSLTYYSSHEESLEEQFDKLARLLAKIDRYQKDFIRFQADTELLQSIVEDTMTGIMYLLRNKIQWVNRGLLRILETSEHELVGKELSTLFPDEQQYREVFKALLRNREHMGWGIAPCSLVRKNGGILECTIRMRRLNPMNPQKGYLIIIDDNHDRRYLEKALGDYQEKIVKSEEKYLEIFQKMDLIIVRTDLNGQINFWNARAEATFGFQPGEVAGNNIIDVITDRESRTAKDMSVLLYDTGFTHENTALHVLENRKKNGENRWIAWNILTSRNSSGSPAGIVWIGQDISEIDGNDHITIKSLPWKNQILKGTDVKEEIFDLIFHTAIELGRGGRESRKVGTSFMLGDSEKVMAESRQCGINSFDGKIREKRMVQTKGNIENIKNLALLDGAFVISGSGYIHASCRHLLADTIDIDLSEGYGTRHASAAAMTKITKSVGIVLSESGGITIFKDGEVVKRIIL